MCTRMHSGKLDMNRHSRHAPNIDNINQKTEKSRDAPFLCGAIDEE